MLRRLAGMAQRNSALIGVFTGAAVIGALAGGSLAGHANPQRLSAAFTLLVLIVAATC